MKRREFIKASIVAPIVAATPISLFAESYKYPIIGQPYYGIIMDKDRWYVDVSNWLKYKIHSSFNERIYSIDDMRNNRVEVFIKKVKNHFAHQERIMLPTSITYIADTIVDMETFTILKHRNDGVIKGEMKIPVGANEQLVMENRKKWLT